MGRLKDLIQQIVFVFLSAEKKDVIVTLQDYAAAFMTFDPENVLGYFDLPMTFLSDDGMVIFNTRDDIASFVSGLMQELQTNEYAKDDLSKFHIKTLAPDAAVTSFHLVRVNKAGEAFGRFNAVYTWRKTNESWKLVIAVLLSP